MYVKAIKVLITVIFLSILALTLGGSLAVFTLEVADDRGEILLQKEYPLSLSFRLKVKLKYGGDYRDYYESFSIGKDALDGIDEDIYNDITALAENVKIKPKNAIASFDGNAFSYEPETLGRMIDVAKLQREIVVHMGKITRVVAYFDALEPSLTLARLKEATKLRGCFTTCLGGSSEGRVSNIKKASARLNGTKVEPNEVFSFNQIIGDRTLENGYLKANVIENGKFTEGVGGGVCQVSTTLYNAVVLSGLKETKLFHHSLPVGYVEPSRDAMVSSVADFKFLNTSPFPVYIASHAEGTKLTVKIYGDDLTDGLTPRIISEVIREIPCSNYVDFDGNSYSHLPPRLCRATSP